MSPKKEWLPVNSQPRWVWQEAQSTICQQQPGNQVNSLVGAPCGQAPGACRKQRMVKAMPAGLKNACSCWSSTCTLCLQWVITALQAAQTMA